jgi:uncharacterized protein (TIGR04255 family)
MMDKIEDKWPSLAKPPVVTAIFQLKFDNGSVKVEDYLKFDHLFMRDFQKRSENIESSLSFGPATRIPLGKAQVSGVTNTRRTGYVYVTTDQKEKLSLSESDITYTTEKPYEGWDAFKETVIKVLRILSPMMENVTVRRTSIRFINQFKFDEFSDPTVYFNSQVFSTEGAMPYPLMRYGFRLTYDVEEGIYSIVNQNAEHLPEKYVYIFDIDVLNRNNFLYDVNSIAETMEGLRNIKNRIFFDNVTEKTLETCN